MNLQTNPKSILIIDSIGALFSAILLGLVLTKFESEFGMPKSTLYVLAMFPCIFIAYDLIGYFFIKSSIKKWIKQIAFLNLAYCMLSVIMLVYHNQHITPLGWLYFIGELAIVLFLIKIELNLAQNEIT